MRMPCYSFLAMNDVTVQDSCAEDTMRWFPLRDPFPVDTGQLHRGIRFRADCQLPTQTLASDA